MKKKILIIDDSNTSLNNVKKMLEEMNILNYINIYSANNGFEGIIQAVKINPDLIFMDWHMDGLDGLQAIYILRKHPSFAEVPIIMLSGDGGVIDKAKGMLIGANDFLSKGLSYSDYLHTINSYLDLQLD